MKERILTVNKQVTRMEGELDVTEPKTKNSVRKVALSQQAVDLLVQEHEQHPDNPILFPSPRTGGYWSPDAVSRINRKLLKNAGIEEHVRFHDLRHTFATMAISSGVDVKTLSSMLGHYSAGFTLDTYTHITNDMQRGAAEKIGGFMESATATTTPEASRPAGGEPVQGDTVREGGIKETKPKGQNYCPLGYSFSVERKTPSFLCGQCKNSLGFCAKVRFGVLLYYNAREILASQTCQHIFVLA